jgi:hypothetical protein
MANVAIGRTAYNQRPPQRDETDHSIPTYTPQEIAPAPTPEPSQPARMQQINAANPNGDNIHLPFVQEGNTGGYQRGVGVTLGEGTSMTAADRDRYLAEARGAGVSDDYINWFVNPGGYTSGGTTDYNRILPTWMQEYGPNAGGSGGGSGSGGSGGGRQVASGSDQFTDPITSLIEAAARGRVERLENPPPDSGQALLEKMLRDVSQQFSAGGYTNAEQEIFQTRAMEPLEQLRAARKQQVAQQLQQRGHVQTSGVWKQMMADVDRQFDGLRAQTQRDLASTEAQERTNRILQALGLTGQLASQEEGRLDRAFNYRTVPLNLADRSFNQAMQLYQTNNPLSLVNPLLQLSQAQQGRSDQGMAGLADLIWILTGGAT